MDIFKPPAPPCDAPFPPNARLTAYELLAFFPNSIQSSGIIHRFVSNSATRRAICSIVNAARDLQKEWTEYQCGTALKKTMNRAGYLNWTMTEHVLCNPPRNNSWNESSLYVINSPAPGGSHVGSQPWKSILFRDLAKSVRRWPQGNEALDLTRIVAYCVGNPDERWMFPQDYNKLLSVLGGPAQISLGHADHQIFEQWQNVKTRPHQALSLKEQEIAKEVLDKKRMKKTANSATLKTQEKRSESAMLKVAEQRGLRAMPRTRIRLKERDKEEKHRSTGNEEKVDLKKYTRASAKYVATSMPAAAPSSVAVARTFVAEHDAGETHMFSAYAFGGPRQHPPYRMLHDIEQPDKSDISGWAENLRWAFEQRACFWHSMKTDEWNESPAHMEFIANMRHKQTWVSEEVLEKLQLDDSEV